jgi:hypothetical protein
MIEKDPGNPQLHRLRVIHLYESDYNSLLGIKMRQVIHNAKDRKSLNVGLYGSRAARQAVDAAFIEVLQYDYASLTRWPELKFSNDATSCYDRIIPSISNVIARSMGLHKNIAEIRDAAGKTTPVEHSSAYHAYKTLGTFQAATKRQTIQYQMLKKKATTLLRNLALSTCSANAAWLYYSSIFFFYLFFFNERDWISTVCQLVVKNSTETTSSSYYRINP